YRCARKSHEHPGHLQDGARQTEQECGEQTPFAQLELCPTLRFHCLQSAGMWYCSRQDRPAPHEPNLLPLWLSTSFQSSFSKSLPVPSVWILPECRPQCCSEYSGEAPGFSCQCRYILRWWAVV